MSELAAHVVELHRQTADDLVSIGPDAPSGLDDWSAGDLGAHLVSQTGAARYGLAGVRFALMHGFHPSPAVGARANARGVRRYGGSSFTKTIERIRNGPPTVLLLRPISPIALFEIWTHGDDLRRANGLGAGRAPKSLDLAIDWLVRFHQTALAGTTVDRSAPVPELMRWLTGRPSALGQPDRRLRI